MSNLDKACFIIAYCTLLFSLGLIPTALHLINKGGAKP